MIRSRLLLSATLLTLYSAAAFGLGLGKLELNSALNQTFSAEIDLVNTGGLEPEEIVPALASLEDFERYGVERTYLLTDLRFEIRRRESGELYLEVISTNPIQEPFLNFIVEILWPNGKLLSEYTVLLDPPVFGEQGIAPIEPAKAAESDGQSATSSKPSRKAPSISVAAPMTQGDVLDDEYGVTGPGDTLWTIALKVRPNGSVTVQQTMLALQRLNPDAFINNNINLLKAGHVLRIPTSRDITEETPSDAVSEVRMQNQEFEEYRSSGVAQLDATRRQRSEVSEDSGADDGELKLLAADRSSGQRAGDSDARVADLENELAITREDLDRARRSNGELNVRLDDLAGQIETLNEIVKLKDDQLAAWRAEMQKVQDSSAKAPSAPASAPVKPAQAEGSLLTNPFVLGGLLVLVIAGLVAGMVVMRKRKEGGDLAEEDFAEVSLQEEQEEEEETSSEESSEEEGDESDEEADEDLSQQTSDVLSEAEIYIAYGRFPQAIAFLENAVEAEPDRSDIQLKLLEVYVQTEDATAFNLQFDQLKTLGDEEAIATATELQNKIAGAAETAAAAMDATVVSSEPIEAVVEEDGDDDDLSFDLDDLDSETENEELDLGDGLELDDEEDIDLNLDDEEDLDLNLDDDEELDLDLGDEELDIDLDADDAATSEPDLDDTLALEEDELDIDLDLDADTDDALDDTVSLESDEVTLDDELDLGDSDDLDLGDLDDELDLGDLDDDDDAISLDLDADDEDIDLEAELNLEAEGESLDLDDDDAISLDLDADDDINLEEELSLEAEGESLDLDDDDAISLDLDGDDDLGELDLGDDTLAEDDDAISLDLDDDLGDLDLEADEDVNLDLDDDEDLGELNLDEDASSKLDLARAYVDMGDNDGARALLNEVVLEGDAEQIQEANELLEKLD